MTTPVRRSVSARALLWFGMAAGAVLPLSAQVTEIAETIQPGKFLLEMDAISLGFDRDRSTDNKFDALGLARTVVSAGLTRDVDLQVGVQLFVRTTYHDRGFRDTRSGLGDLTLRTKWAFWRDEQLGAVAAVIPYVKIPSRAREVGNGAVEGGLIVPWSMTLPGGIKTGAMAQWDFLRNDANNGYDSRWFASAYAHRNFTQFLGFYGESTLTASSASSSSFAGSLGGGATLTVSKNFRWDYGISRGLGTSGTDWIHVLRFKWGF
jgi:hypothetical protein